jgi:hypothetical protein
VGPKLTPEVPLRFFCPRKYYQTARVAIQAMHGTEPTKHPTEAIRQSSRQVPSAALAKFRRLRLMPHRRQSRRLVDNHDLVVGVDDDKRRLPFRGTPA